MRFRGISPFITREVCGKLIQYPLYDELKRQVCVDPAQPELKETILCGATSPVLPGLLTTPLDVVKTRMMVDAKVSHLSMGGIFNRILFEEAGVRGLFRGVTPRLFSSTLCGAMFFPTYEMSRSYILSGGA